MRFLAPLLLVCLIASCSDDPVSWRDTYYDANDAAEFDIGRVVTASSDSVVVRDFASAVLRHPDSLAIYGGPVTVNGVELPVHEGAFVLMASNDTLGVAYRLEDGAPMKFGGAPHVFSVAGSALFPAFDDSIASLGSEMVVTSPSIADTASKSRGFTITWDASPDPASRVNAFVFSYDRDSLDPHFGLAIDRKDLPDNGSFVVTPEMLRNYPTGTMFVTVQRHRVKRGEYAPNRRYTMKVSSEFRARLVLAE